MLDKAPTGGASTEKLILRTHPVTGGDLQAADDVLQTMLGGEDVRLAQDAVAGHLIVLASESVHRRIEETLAKLQGEGQVFEMIPLTKVEPYVALSIVREMLDIPFIPDEKDPNAKKHPRLDWDTPSMRIFVRGTKSQVEEVKKIVQSLDQPRLGRFRPAVL